MILDQEVNWETVPEDFRLECQSCGGAKHTTLIEDDGSQEICSECDGRGWVLGPIQELLDEINAVREYSQPEHSQPELPKKYHGWLAVEPDRDGEKRYRARFNTGGGSLNEISYQLPHILEWMEKQIGSSFEIEENLGAIGAFKVFTWIEEPK